MYRWSQKLQDHQQTKTASDLTYVASSSDLGASADTAGAAFTATAGDGGGAGVVAGAGGGMGVAAGSGMGMVDTVDVDSWRDIVPGAVGVILMVNGRMK